MLGNKKRFLFVLIFLLTLGVASTTPTACKKKTPQTCEAEDASYRLNQLYCGGLLIDLKSQANIDSVVALFSHSTLISTIEFGDGCRSIITGDMSFDGDRFSVVNTSETCSQACGESDLCDGKLFPPQGGTCTTKTGEDGLKTLELKLPGLCKGMNARVVLTEVLDRE